MSKHKPLSGTSVTKQAPTSNRFSRRTLLKLGAGIAGAGLVVGVAYDHRFAILGEAMQYMGNKSFDPSAFIVIPAEGKIQLICHRSEMGQGIRTGLPMLLAEELEVEWDQVEIIQAEGDPKYGSQNTDGSKSITAFYDRLRKAAAGVRELLIMAAADHWYTRTGECYARNGAIHHRATGRKLTYQSLAVAASTLTMPHDPPLKSHTDFRIIGKPRDIVDVDAMTSGKALYGIDIKVPNMVYACALRAPVPGAKLKAFDDSHTRKVKGVIDVLKLSERKAPDNTNESICVIATNTWAAIKGKEALKAQWDTTSLKLDHTAAYKAELEKSLTRPTSTHLSKGSIKGAKQRAKEVVTSEYHTPFLVHAPMEPLVCTAHVTAKGCEVWAPCQDPQRAIKSIAKMLALDPADITFHVTFLGGGFGRKSQPDFILEAVGLSKKLKRPVKLQWTREDEIKHGFYHAQAFQRITAALDADGMPIGWHHQAVYPSIYKVFMPSADEPMFFELGMGATNLPYRIPNVLIEAGKTKTSLRIGWLRSVCNLFHSFAVNNMINELATRAKVDPIEYRLKLIGAPQVLQKKTPAPQDTGRLRKVIEKTRDAFAWNQPLPPGHGKGFASHFSFRSYVAVAMEASCNQGVIKVHRVVITIDCGLAINPTSVQAQMEGSVAFGLSAALYGKITTKDGVVEQSNYHDYPVLRANEMPKVLVHIINGDPNKPQGVGEPGVPPIAPALAAALYQVTGKRLTDMPFAEQVI